MAAIECVPFGTALITCNRAGFHTMVTLNVLHSTVTGVLAGPFSPIRAESSPDGYHDRTMTLSRLRDRVRLFASAIVLRASPAKPKTI
jgi:hypothetical protein